MCTKNRNQKQYRSNNAKSTALSAVSVNID